MTNNLFNLPLYITISFVTCQQKNERFL